MHASLFLHVSASVFISSHEVPCFIRILLALLSLASCRSTLLPKLLTTTDCPTRPLVLVRPQPFIYLDLVNFPYFIGLSLVIFLFSLRLSDSLLQGKQDFSSKVHHHVSHCLPHCHLSAKHSRMSLAPYYYRPITPPEVAAGQRGHCRNYSNISNASSYYSSTFDTSPESVITNNTTPSRSPVLRHNGPTLLPKIRTQDSSLDPSTAGQSKGGHRRGSSTSNASVGSQRPPMYRCATEPVESTKLISPISNPAYSRASSVTAYPSPGLAHANLHRTKQMHSRSGSASSVDSNVLSRFGYPTYRKMPVYAVQQQTPSPAFYPQDYYPSQASNLMEPPMINLEGTFDMPIDLETISRPASVSPPPAILPSQPAYQTSSLLGYLAQPTQPINLVRHLGSGPGRGMVNHFWWDVRAVRPWDSFSFSTFSAIPDLMTLLNFQHDSSSLPNYATNASSLQTLTPGNETDLTSVITKTYFPRANAAALLTLGGPNSMALYAAPPTATANTSAPNFLANYPSDGDKTITGLPRGRVVGLAKSFDKWNTGMRREGPARKVEFLKGLAHLQKCMRDHSCRYGFIITEIELLCVRAGCDERGNPYFGYLELAETIPTKSAYDVSQFDPMEEDMPMTATLGLYFLLMLAKSTPLPGEPGSFMDVGGPGALTRQRVWPGLDLAEEERGKEGRDKWMPEPQVGEKREAKTVRGWVWPADPWSKRENPQGAKRRG